MNGALAGAKVLSFGRFLAGPYAAMLLADLGAEVIKVETPKRGDDARNNPPFIQDVSAYFLSINRGKKSITLNLRQPAGIDIVKALIQKVDILIENFRPGTMAAMGLAYQDVQVLNPALIYVSISGFGQSGPHALRPAYDMVAQGMGGTVSITGEPGRPPVRVGYSIGDLGAALFATNAALAALYERQQSGQGQYIDVAMLDCQVALCENACARYFASGEIPAPTGSRHPVLTPFQVFSTQTDDMVVIAFGDGDWGKLCRVLERQDLLEDARFATISDRTRNQAAREPILSEIFWTRPRDVWLAILEQAGLVASPVNNIEQVVHDPQVVEREMVLQVEHPRLGKLETVGTPIKLSRTPCRVEKAAPDLGADTKTVLTELLNLTADQIADLEEAQVI